MFLLFLVCLVFWIKCFLGDSVRVYRVGESVERGFEAMYWIYPLDVRTGWDGCNTIQCAEPKRSILFLFFIFLSALMCAKNVTAVRPHACVLNLVKSSLHWYRKGGGHLRISAWMPRRKGIARAWCVCVCVCVCLYIVCTKLMVGAGKRAHLNVQVGYWIGHKRCKKRLPCDWADCMPMMISNVQKKAKVGRN